MTAKAIAFCTVLAFSHQDFAGIDQIESPNPTLTLG
jgi:hypothetical protein